MVWMHTQVADDAHRLIKADAALKGITIGQWIEQTAYATLRERKRNTQRKGKANGKGAVQKDTA